MCLLSLAVWPFLVTNGPVRGKVSSFYSRGKNKNARGVIFFAKSFLFLFLFFSVWCYGATFLFGIAPRAQSERSEASVAARGGGYQENGHVRHQWSNSIQNVFFGE